MNKILLIGNLGKDPEVRYTQDGNAVAHFSLGVRRSFGRDGNYETDWFNCACFGKRAEVVEKHLRKGSKIGVTGEMQQNNYTNKEGQKVYSFQVMVESFDFLDKKSTNAEATAVPDGGSDPNDFVNIPDDIEDKLPFH